MEEGSAVGLLLSCSLERTFGPDDMDELVWFLVKHDAVAFLPSSGPA